MKVIAARQLRNVLMDLFKDRIFRVPKAVNRDEAIEILSADATIQADATDDVDHNQANRRIHYAQAPDGVPLS